jgi:hypothetical protein
MDVLKPERRSVIRIVVRNIIGKYVWDVVPVHVDQNETNPVRRTPSPEFSSSFTMNAFSSFSLYPTSSVPLMSLLTSVLKMFPGVDLKSPTFGDTQNMEVMGMNYYMYEKELKNRSVNYNYSNLDGDVYFSDKNENLFGYPKYQTAKPIPGQLTLLSLLSNLGVIYSNIEGKKSIVALGDDNLGKLTSQTLTDLLLLHDVLPTRACINTPVYYFSATSIESFNLNKIFSLETTESFINKKEEFFSLPFFMFVHSLGMEIGKHSLPHIGFGWEYLEMGEKKDGETKNWRKEKEDIENLHDPESDDDDSNEVTCTEVFYYRSLTDEVMFHIAPFMFDYEEKTEGQADVNNDISDTPQFLTSKEKILSNACVCVVWWEGDYEFSVDLFRLLLNGKKRFNSSSEMIFTRLLFSVYKKVVVVVPIPTNCNNPTLFRVYVVNVPHTTDKNENDDVIFPLVTGLIIPQHLLSLIITSTIINLHHLLQQQCGRDSFLDNFAYRLLVQKKIRDLKCIDFDFSKIISDV